MVRNQAHMSETNLGFVALLGDFKSDFRAVPLVFVLDKIELAVYNKPNDFLAGNKFCNLLFRIMVGLVTIRKLIADFIGAAFHARVSCPPSTNVVNGSKDFFRRLAYRKRSGVIGGLHCLFSSSFLSLGS